jgi:predicted GH43/DUF377 family glycosyl hydrolase
MAPIGGCLLYHGALISCNGFVYSSGAALLDLEQPWKVISKLVVMIMLRLELIRAPIYWE